MINIEAVKRRAIEVSKSIGPKCQMHLSIELKDHHLVSGWMYPLGDTGPERPFIYHSCETFDELLDYFLARWRGLETRVHDELVKQMALEIVRLTGENGECTEAALRQKFDPKDIERFGPSALRQADGLASNAPFSIVPSPGGNAPYQTGVFL